MPGRVSIRPGHMAKCDHCGSLYEVACPTAHGPIEVEALRLLSEDLVGIPEDCWRFFRALWGPAPGLPSVKRMAAELAVCPSTLLSRFYRAGLPSPKRYLLSAQLTRAARLLENTRTSIVSVALDLDASSPQSFGRTIKAVTGMTAARFREEYDGARMLELFRSELILPYQQQFLALTPLIAPDCGGREVMTERRAS